MNIGIDIDGVIQDCENYFRTYAEIYDVDVVKKGICNPQAPRIQERMSWNDEEFWNFVRDYMLDIMRTAPLLPGVKDVLPKLKNMGHKLIVLTARGSFVEEEIKIAKEMIKNNGLQVDKVCFNSGNKLNDCIKENIDYMIDDSSNNIKVLIENGIKCLYFRRLGTENIQHDNVKDVQNWGDVYRFFCELNKKENN